MAEVSPPLTSTLEAFGAVRGEHGDKVWAWAVSWMLTMDDVDIDQIRGGLDEALALVAETQESPEDLFGEPRQHADDLYQHWLSEGRLMLADPPTPAWRETATTGLALSAFYAVAFVAVLGLRDGADNSTSIPEILLISLIVGFGSTLGHAAWTRRHRRRSRLDAPADEQWSLALTEILRTRYSMSGSRVRGIVAEAHSYAAEADRKVQEEFGTPEEYAARFAPDVTRRRRLTTALLASMATLSALQLVDGFSWTAAGLVACFATLTLAEHRRHR